MGTCIRFGLIDSDHDILDTYTSSMNSMDFLDSIDILDVSWMCLWIFCNYTGYAVMLCNWWPWACFCMGACRSCSQEEYVSYCLCGAWNIPVRIERHSNDNSWYIIYCMWWHMIHCRGAQKAPGATKYKILSKEAGEQSSELRMTFIVSRWEVLT